MFSGGNPYCYKWNYHKAPHRSCCSNENPCGEQEGDCDYDSECADDLICGFQGCSVWGYMGYDCCEKGN